LGDYRCGGCNFPIDGINFCLGISDAHVVKGVVSCDVLEFALCVFTSVF
jgi:hypothetical protein